VECLKSNKEQKLLNHRINGCQYPFIDEDLQLRIPGLESSLEKQQGEKIIYHQIYSHYLNPTMSPSHSFLKGNEEKLQRNMIEVQKAYESWKIIQRYIQKIIENHQF
jgi:hypothetical protein